jgi:tyrosine-specific transport protein
MKRDFLLAAGLLAGTTIGAGIFSLPYVFSRLGLVSGLFYLIAFATVYFFIHLMYGRLLQAQPGEHQFFYLAKKYLPEKLSGFASFAILGELVFVLTVYLILAPTFFEAIFGFSKNIMFLGLVLFWLAGSIFTFMKLKWLSWAELLGVMSVIGIVAVIVISSLNFSLQTPSFKRIDWPAFFLPFGPLLFSMSGRPALHKVIEEYRKAKKEGRDFSLGGVIFVGTLVPAVIYFLFVVGVLRLNPSITPAVLDGLRFLTPVIYTSLSVLGIITLWTSYSMIGVNVRDILRLDLKCPRWASVCLTIFPPLLLFFLGFRNFLPMLTFTGSIFLGLEGIFVVAMWRKAFPESGWRRISPLLYVVFFTAIGFEIFKLVS